MLSQTLCTTHYTAKGAMDNGDGSTSVKANVTNLMPAGQKTKSQGQGTKV